jgi:hypothetical protein
VVASEESLLEKKARPGPTMFESQSWSRFLFGRKKDIVVLDALHGRDALMIVVCTYGDGYWPQNPGDDLQNR